MRSHLRPALWGFALSSLAATFVAPFASAAPCSGLYADDAEAIVCIAEATPDRVVAAAAAGLRLGGEWSSVEAGLRGDYGLGCGGELRALGDESVLACPVI